MLVLQIVVPVVQYLGKGASLHFILTYGWKNQITETEYIMPVRLNLRFTYSDIIIISNDNL